jgi:hypothetical protein
MMVSYTLVRNHISETVDTQYIKPSGASPVITHVVSGKGNYISNNHIVATAEASEVQAVATLAFLPLFHLL